MNTTNLKQSIKFVRYFCIQNKPSNVKPFEDIPGPTGLFGVGTFYKYLPIIGM